MKLRVLPCLLLCLLLLSGCTAQAEPVEATFFAMDTIMTLRVYGGDQALLDRLARSDTHQSAEFISIFYGEDVTEEQAQKAEAIFTAACPNAEVSLLSGGQPVYYYMISAE